MKIAVAQMGARMHYAIPRILESAGILGQLFTDVCASKGWPKLLHAVPKPLRTTRHERLLTRVPKGISPEKITPFNGFGFEYARRLVRAESGSERDETFLWANIEFARLISNKGFGDAGGVYCFNTAALEIFQYASELGLKRVLEQTISPRAIEERLLTKEQEAFPTWERAPDNRYAMILAQRERQEWNLADVILCASEYVKNGIIECGGPAEKCAVVPYGIERSPADIDRSSRMPGPLRVLAVGAVGLRKGSPYVMQAAELLKGEAEFLMLGSHNASPEAIKQLQMHVHAPGPVPRPTMPSHYAWADVFLLPSLCEGSATSTYEAIFHGLPVICTPHTGSVIRDGLDGFIVPARSPTIIAERLRQLASDPALLASMSLSALKRSSEYTLSCYSKNLMHALVSAKIIGFTSEKNTMESNSYENPVTADHFEKPDLFQSPGRIMRIGHLTLFHSYNYGGMLQAWATQRILRSHGHEVITLDYHPGQRMQLLRKLFPGMRSCHEVLGRFIDKCQYAGVDLFNAFRKDNFTFSSPCTGPRDLERACTGMDAVVVGSDQVWSPSWVRPPYFIDFKLPTACKRVSLAACCGARTGDPAYLAYVARTLSRFDDLSVRNAFTADLVKQTTGRSPTVICDPTLAIDVPADPVPGISAPYILAYIINRKHSVPLATDVLLKLKRQTGLPVYSIPPAEFKGQCGLPADQVLGPITPFQWNHLIANASWLVTDSFHGTIFALKNHRDLIVISSGFETAGRIEAVLSATELTDRMVTSSPEGDIPHIVFEKWQASDRYLSKESARYHEFLAKSLGTAPLAAQQS